MHIFIPYIPNEQPTMTRQEQLLIKSVADQLEKSTRTDWTQGDLSAWSAWAYRMRDTIRSTMPTLQTLISDQYQAAHPTPSPDYLLAARAQAQTQADLERARGNIQIPRQIPPNYGVIPDAYTKDPTQVEMVPRKRPTLEDL
jgi:hypothetical protein